MNELKIVREKYPFIKSRVLSEELGRSAASIRLIARKNGISKSEKNTGEFTHGLYKTERVLKLIKMLHESPCTISNIQDELGVLERTAYRHISLLIASGIKIEKEGKQYFISRKNCPICGHTTNNTLR